MQISTVTLSCIAVCIDISISFQTRWLLIGHTAPHSMCALFSAYNICCYSPVLGQAKIHCSVVLVPAVSALLHGIRVWCYQSNLLWFKGIMWAPFISNHSGSSTSGIWMRFPWQPLDHTWILNCVKGFLSVPGPDSLLLKGILSYLCVSRSPNEIKLPRQN